MPDFSMPDFCDEKEDDNPSTVMPDFCAEKEDATAPSDVDECANSGHRLKTE